MTNPRIQAGTPSGRLRTKELPLKRVYLLILAALVLSGCATGPGAIKDVAGPKPAPNPFSKQWGILSQSESNRVELVGVSGTPVTMIRTSEFRKLRLYRRLDPSTVFLPRTLDNGTAQLYTQKMHQWVAERIRKHGYQVGTSGSSQAGVAVIYSPFRSLSGRTAFEIVVIVFDRRIGARILSKSMEKNALPVLKESAVWISATRLYPKTDLPPWPDPEAPQSAEMFQALFDSAFANFTVVSGGG